MPAPLRPGDKVRVVAPCGSFDRQRFLDGLEILVAADLQIALDDAVFAKHRYLAGDDETRHRDLSAALADPEARAVWIARGGYGATRLLPRLELERVRAADKWLVGFSDVTALHALFARAGLASVHGANVTTLPTWTPEARRELFDLLMKRAPATYGGMPIAAGRGRGPIVGGNLTVLAAMAGTGALPAARGAIVLLEDIGERPYRLDRAFTQLLQAGFFAGAAGIAIGQLSGCDEPGEELRGADVLCELAAGLGVPVVAGLPLGHDPASRAVLLGVVAELDGQKGTLEVSGA